MVARPVGVGTAGMISQSRQATRHQTGARRPSRSYYNLRCAACGRQDAAVAPCPTCSWPCHVNDARCHRAHLPKTFAAAMAQPEGWNVVRGKGR